MSIKVKIRKSLFEDAVPVQGNNQQTDPVANNTANQQQPANQQPVNNAAQQAAPAQQPAQPANQQPANNTTQQQEKVPEVKPQVNAQGAEQANQANLINGCLSGLVGLLNRQDAGGVYLKAIENNKNASDELKKAAQTFSSINPQDINAVIQGFSTFANVCSQELQKMQQQTQGNNAQQQTAQQQQ